MTSQTPFVVGMFGLFQQAWRFFQLYIPGTRITFAAFGLFLLFAPLVLNFFKQLFGLGGVSGLSSLGQSAQRASKEK